jgi:histidinol-phosphate/aromatic aminotransferase/cobyric acid decarboxylase-like protein
VGGTDVRRRSGRNRCSHSGDSVERVIPYGIGTECDRLEQRYAAYLGAKHFVLAASGSNAFAAAMTAVGLGPGDEVLIPAHTYTEWDQVLIGAGAAHPLMNPYTMPANAECRRTYSKECARARWRS